MSGLVAVMLDVEASYVSQFGRALESACVMVRLGVKFPSVGVELSE